MSSWTKNLEDKFLEMRMQEYNKHETKSSSNKFISHKVKSITLIVGIIFIILLSIEMILILIGMLSKGNLNLKNTFLPADSGAINLLWNYQIKNQLISLGEISYSLTSLTISIIFIGSAAIVSLLSFAYSLWKDDYYSMLSSSKLKKQFLATLIATVISFLLFLVLSFVGISPTNAPTNTTDLLQKINANKFNLSFVLDDEFNLVPSGYGMFISIIQVLMFVLSIPWLIGFTCNINFSIFKK
ncbi:hypothetical protein [Mycoplasmoides alvi]|uniref:hypothetical protein n=1 Tax=Mycoplasmoides alvi TaxID=78580 RepID=UPI00051BEC4E|nr:hypothetical protein [Mycoplasmoides alvi]